ncbi:MAG TPA: ATP-dependent DNA helicase [Acidobacteriota bacterium]|jgi:ATP-dependent DNA helicase DinG|nr:ATP-dependent DNA helicase [Acidobacteriota bacterium]
MDYQSIFGPTGALSRHHPSFEYRPSQVKMACAVDAAIRGRHHLCAEAGTGTGKTLAYLFPAIANRKRTIISTATRALQEQLFFKDIPFLQQTVAPDLTALCMKGRGNYLCLKKLETQTQNPALMADDRGRLLESLKEWSARTQTGDRAELDFLRDDDPFWHTLDARRETCLGQKCPQYEPCFITRLRQEAFSVDLIIVNHSLFFADLALRRRGIAGVLPDYSVVIFDEAHEIEEIATNFFGRQVSNYRFEDYDIDLVRTFQKETAILRTGSKMLDSARRFFELLENDRIDQRRTLSWIAGQPELVERSEAVEQSLQLLISQMGKRASRTEEQESLKTRAEELLDDFHFICSVTDPSYVYWIEKRSRAVVLNASPIDLAPILAQLLFDQPISVILTSATLTTDNSFRYIRNRLGFHQAEELILDSEFDLNSQSMLYIPMLPDPRQHQYLERACAEIERLLEISRGRAFLLFTSFAQMERCYERLLPDLKFPVFKQGDLPKNLLLEKFRSTPSSVLFATTSFWQGVDVQGDALSCVVIDKLPFAVPTDPIVAARMQYLQSQGRNAFEEYSVPQAIILLKQGLGRLIRSRQDRGILSILDSRILTKSYGRQFLESLPKCPITDNIEGLSNFFNSK